MTSQFRPAYPRDRSIGDDRTLSHNRQLPTLDTGASATDQPPSRSHHMGISTRAAQTIPSCNQTIAISCEQ